MIAAIKKLSKREKIMMAATFITIVLALFQYVYTPGRKKLKELDAKIAAVKVETQVNQITLQALQQRSLASVNPGTTMLDKYTQENAVLANLITSISTTKDLGYFEIKRLSAEKPEDAKEYKRATFTLDVETSFLSLGRFLEELENSALLAEIHTVEITRVTGDLQKVLAKIKLDGYFARE